MENGEGSIQLQSKDNPKSKVPPGKRSAIESLVGSLDKTFGTDTICIGVRSVWGRVERRCLESGKGVHHLKLGSIWVYAINHAGSVSTSFNGRTKKRAIG